MKILHFSDLHLDAPFAENRFPTEISKQCRLRLRRSLAKLLKHAQQNNIDIVTIGGDLFEGDRIRKETLHYLAENFERIAPTPIFIAPGNHDYFSPESPYQRFDWPDNVTIFTQNKFTPIEIHPEITLWGYAHHAPDIRENPLEKFRVPDDGKSHILIFHGSETGPFSEARAAHCPFQLSDIEQSGVTFALLGHYHKARLLPTKNPIAAYPGSPQPLNFSETGAHSAVILELDSGTVQLSAFPSATQHFHNKTISISAESTTNSLLNDLTASIKKRGDEANFLRLTLSGFLGANHQIDLEMLEQQLKEHFDFIEIIDKTRPDQILDHIAKEPTVKGAFVRNLRELQDLETEDQELIQLAIKYGLYAFEGEQLDIE